ncbi:ribosomal subunit interface protein [Tistlia consotensis]|uniref:Ribosome hibernation promoting factor n=1 Tax=Tistlia consotensis USBA 355 TaxID=560819 RepID=A0A1Y6B5C8_9PROT|nr:ribosome-associated translation inhibitor RaiA [Tistlia consotensis]SME93145.1 SSU ribosomal protein S30P /sigma 54 modulation protein [Tistlia consotensis USBA 355]SNR28445.1 ribosomal subunit interface protein [Tistlia consotensis]
MQLTVKGRHIDTGDAFRRHAESSLSAIFGKYFGDAIEATVTLSRDAHLFRAQISAHVGRNIELVASGTALEVYPAFDQAAEHLSKRLRRHKRRLRDHAAPKPSEQVAESLMARQVVLSAEETPEGAADEEGSGEPAVVAEMEMEVPELTVHEAVMRLDLAELPALMFRNRSHGGLNMVYRRADGHVGWVDPRGNRATS